MSDRSEDPRANLQYVHDMLDQLIVVSGGQGGPFLTYLIDMAKLEAAGALQRLGGDANGLDASPHE